MPLDNVFIERLWGTLKYEDVYLNEYGTLCDLREGLKECFTRYNTWRTDQALGKRTDLSSKTRGGAFWLFGFMVQGGFEVQRGFIAEGRVQACSIIEAFDVVKNHEFGLFSGFWKR